MSDMPILMGLGSPSIPKTPLWYDRIKLDEHSNLILKAEDGLGVPDVIESIRKEKGMSNDIQSK